MPKMYAYNTSATQVKKRYAMIGSTATQVKKRYAMIGSTATLVYSAEMPLFTSGTGKNVGWSSHTARENSGSQTPTVTDNSPTNLFADTKNGSDDSGDGCLAGWYTTDAIDVTGYSKLTLTFSSLYTRWDSYNYIIGGLLSDGKPSYKDGKNKDMIPFVASNIFADKKATTQKDVTWEIDISGVTGSYVVGVYAVKTYENSRQATFYLTGAKLE
ncbi:MAG: hypothetical protein IKY90_04280 [Oscillospiraceae bacterium]|nr:hypothetical protein [Oscillospiraceae bacterium]